MPKEHEKSALAKPKNRFFTFFGCGWMIILFATDGRGLELPPRSLGGEPVMEDYLKTWKDTGHVFEKFQKKLKMMVREYNGIVLSSHNMKQMPADGDSLISVAANLRAIQLEAQAIGRPIQVISDIEQIGIFDPGTLYVFYLPISDQEIGFVEEDRQTIAAFNNSLSNGKTGLIVTDMRFPLVDVFADPSKPYAFDTLIIQDHHSWTQKMIDNRERFKGDDHILFINNHLLFVGAPYPDAYCSGAFQADLTDVHGDPWFTFLKQAGLFADKYADQFPQTVREVEAEYATNVTETLNILGTYIFDWKKDGIDVSTQEKRATLLDLILAIIASSHFEQLDYHVHQLSCQRFGEDFEAWKQGVLVDIEDSRQMFMQSNEKIVFYQMQSKHAVTLFVHKRVNTLMDTRDEYKDRVLVHYQIDQNKDLDVLIARGKDNNAIDVSLPSKNGPVNISWGGGHTNRGGFSTRMKNPEDAKKLADWWGPEKDSQKILDYVKANLEAQYIYRS